MKFKNTQCILKSVEQGWGLRLGSHKNQGRRFCGRKGGRGCMEDGLPLGSGHDIPVKDRRRRKTARLVGEMLGTQDNN